jgi:hypothetical protein
MPRISATHHFVNSSKSGEPGLPRRTRDYLQNGAQPGTRNDELFQAALQLRDAGYSQSQTEDLLIPRAVADGLSQAEARATIGSAWSREKREPIGRNSDSVHGDNGTTPPQSKQGEQTKSDHGQKRKGSAKPHPLPLPIPEGLKRLLETAFLEGECIGISDTAPNASGERKPHAGLCIEREKWLAKIAQKPISEIYPDHRQGGLYIRINPLKPGGSKDSEITAFRHVLVEFDLDQNGERIPKENQYSALLESGLPISVIVDSGGKSIHAWIRVDAPDRKEYDRRRELIWEYFKVWNPDSQNKNPSRYSSVPGVEREKAWQDFYRSIPDVDSGIVGSIIARSDAHTLRLSMAYAVLDDVALMQSKHLEAAIAFWDYCQRSAQWAFGEKTGNKMADRIYWALERTPQGMTRSQISQDVFGRNCSKTFVDAALSCLFDAGLAELRIDPQKKSGRPAERWFAKGS